MKKKMLSLLSVMAIFVGSTFAQFEGKVVFGLEYELPEAMESQRAMLPSQMDMLISENKTKVIQNTMMGAQIVISDTKNNTSVLLIDMMEQKMAIDMPSPTEEEKAKQVQPKYTYDNKTKKIAGYKCKHAIMTIEDENGEESEMDVYYTEEIPASANDKLKGLKGFPLEYTISPQGLIMTVTAKSVSKEKIKDAEFEIPEGFTKMTMEEFKAAMGGGGM
jgi:GLPGLI family protein